MMDDLRSLRSRLDASRDQLDRLSDVPPVHSARMLGRVFAKVTLPTTTPTYYAVHPVDPGGIEDEGQAGSLAVDTSRTCYFLVLGPKAPAVGDDLIARAIGGRWVASRGGAAAGGGLVTSPGCGCLNTTPATIFLTAVGVYDALGWKAHSDTLTYTTGIGGGPINGWLGATTFTDGFLSLSGSSSNAYRYVLQCPALPSSNYHLRRIYLSLGGTALDTYDYTWSIGLSGNTCTPTWQMTNGTGNSLWPSEGFTMHG